MRDLIDIVLRENALALPSGNPEGQLTLGPLRFDQRDGLGQVPDNQSVDYRGFAVLMTPRQFLRLAERRDFSLGSGLEPIKAALEDGQPMGSPFLDVLFDEDGQEPAKVRQHEGRTRMRAVQELYGDIPALVHIFPAQGLRARHLNLDLIAACRMAMVPQKQRLPLAGPHFAGTVWWQGGWKALP